MTELRDRVGATLDAFLATQREVLAGIAPECVAMADAVAELTTGGKRLRPAFCYWAWRGCGGRSDDEPAVIRVAAALELFQAAALIHDDLMDGSDTRRGRPSVHRRFAADHLRGGWRGPAGRFGTAGAVLTGDICLSWSEELFDGCGAPEAALAAARPVFDRMRTELMAGQYLDVLEQVRPGPAQTAVARARRVIRHKSARYSVEHPLLLGAALAGAPVDLVHRLSEVGGPLGEAFQLRDDVLGVFGDPERTGKPAGDDLREGKRTVLVALTLARAGADERAGFEQGFGDPGLDLAGVERLRRLITSTGALAEVEQQVADLTTQAEKALAATPLAEPAGQELRDLVRAATDRAS